jgi:alpha-L-rhamnosidase
MILGSDLFVGTGFRFEALHAGGEHARLMNEMIHLYLYMIDNGPGTLWEGWGRGSSINHGYPSHAVVWLFKSFLGINIPDEVEKTIDIAPHPCGMTWAKGYTRAGSGVVSVSWKCEPRKFTMDVCVPDGYRVTLKLPDEFWGWNARLYHGDGREEASLAPGQTSLMGIEKSFRLEAERA